MAQFAAFPRSMAPGIRWPAILAGEAAERLAILQQIEENQWRSPEEIRAGQFRQLNRLLRHCRETVPFYRERLHDAGLGGEREVTPEDWLRLPLLAREDIQKSGRSILSTAIPPEHGATSRSSTSGSTGKPVTVVATGLSRSLWHVVTLREHLWQQRDLTATMAVIRRIPSGDATYPHGLSLRQWGKSVNEVFETGPLHALEIESSVAQQAEWLARVDPTYLRSYPTNLLALARYCDGHGVKLAKLTQCLAFGELVQPHVREACREVWGVEIADAYSSQEMGYMSLQAPGYEHHLVQADFVLLEVLGHDARPCRPGEVGRVVVTGLHNFAMPLLRYDIGDFAEVGEACPSGRGLPVLTRILGRQRNMLVDREGNQYWPAFGVKALSKIAPLRQFQLAQIAVDRVEARLVPERALNDCEMARIREHLATRLPGTVTVELKLMHDIPRSAGGKYEDFVNQTGQQPG